MTPWLEKLFEIHKSVTQSIEQQQSAIWAVQVAVGISMVRGGHETEVMRLLGSVLVGCGLPCLVLKFGLKEETVRKLKRHLTVSWENELYFMRDARFTHSRRRLGGCGE